MNISIGDNHRNRKRKMSLALRTHVHAITVRFKQCCPILLKNAHATIMIGDGAIDLVANI